jgi:hypothetical protein
MSEQHVTTPRQPGKNGQLYASWYSFVLICSLLILSGCASFPAITQNQATPIPTVKPKVTPTKPASQKTPIPLTPTSTPTNFYDEISLLHNLLSPQGWMWRVSLPNDRLVIYYGNPFSSAMGPLGDYSDNQLLAKLRQQAKVYADLDPQHPVIPAFDYVTPVAQASPTADGTWRARMPDDSIEHYRELANSNHMLFFMDMQVAHSTVQDEVNNVWSFLQQPGVDLALDPEFDMPPGTTPGVEFGHMSASEINWVIDKLSNLVLTQNLPPKILIIHQFRESMLPDWQNIRVKPGVEVVTSVDGFGTPEAKIGDYNIFDKQQLIQYPGFKLFYRWDQPLMSPSDVLKMNPPPLMVMYQ